MRRLRLGYCLGMLVLARSGCAVVTLSGTVAVLAAEAGDPRAAAVVASLDRRGLAATTLSPAQFCSLGTRPLLNESSSEAVHDNSSFRFVVLPQAPVLGSVGCGVETLVRLASAGVGLGFLGGWPGRLNLTREHITLGVMSPYEPYQLSSLKASRVECHLAAGTAPPGCVAGWSAEFTRPLQGVSAIGWVDPPQSYFFPVLAAVDGKNRSVGWAVSTVFHLAGSPFAGSHWLLSGVTTEQFYSSTVLDVMSAEIEAILTATDEEVAARGELYINATLVEALDKLTSPWPLRFGNVTVGPDAHLHLTPDSSDDNDNLNPNPNPSPSPSPSANVNGSANAPRTAASGNPRYFMLGGDYFRSAFSDSITPSSLTADLANAVAAGLNTLRVYGLGSPPESVKAVFRGFHRRFGLRVLYTLACYKDPAQTSLAGVRAAAAAVAAEFANESWVGFYDLCNEPDDDAEYFPHLTVGNGSGSGGGGGTTLGDLHPSYVGWGDYMTAQCGGWSSTLDPGHCGVLGHPIESSVPAGHLPAFEATSAILGAWIEARLDGLRGDAGERHRLVTVGHNALHSLLPSNAALDFVSHHAYGTSPRDNLSCVYCSALNVSSFGEAASVLQQVWAGNVSRPVTLGEFGTRTTSGLWPLYQPPLSVGEKGGSGGPPGHGPRQLPPPHRRLQSHTSSGRTAPAHGRAGPLPSSLQARSPPSTDPGSCGLPETCVTGVASSLDYYLTHQVTECNTAWSDAVSDNAGPASPHHRCPTTAGVGTTAWDNSVYVECWTAVLAAGKAAGWETCTPTTPPPCGALTFQQSALVDLTVWLRAIASGTDGALRWCLAEKPYPLAVRSDTWTGDDQRDPAAHDAYVSGGRFGFFWYDGTPLGRPKPIALATRFLAGHLERVGEAVWTASAQHVLRITEAPGSAGEPQGFVSFAFEGPGCLFVGGHSSPAGLALQFAAAPGEVATVMLSWGVNSTDCGVVAMATADVVVSVDLGALVGAGCSPQPTPTVVDLLAGVEVSVAAHFGRRGSALARPSSEDSALKRSYEKSTV